MRSQRDLRIEQTKRNVAGFFSAFEHYIRPEDFREVKRDRAYLEPSGSLLQVIRYLQEARIVLPWKASIGKHRLAGYNYRTAARGFRENVGFCSVQIIIHEDADGDVVAVEIDWDWFNPDIREGVYRLGSVFGHVGEFLWYRIAGTKTNSIRVAKVLRKRGYPIEVVAA